MPGTQITLLKQNFILMKFNYKFMIVKLKRLTNQQ